MNGKRKVLVAAAAAGVMLFGIATPANAATGYARCDPGYLCLFTEPNGQGVIAQYKVGDADMGDSFGPLGMNDNAESYWNRSGANWSLYNGPYYGGTVSGMSPDKPDGANFPASLRNVISSLKKM